MIVALMTLIGLIYLHSIVESFLEVVPFLLQQPGVYSGCFIITIWALDSKPFSFTNSTQNFAVLHLI